MGIALNVPCYVNTVQLKKGATLTAYRKADHGKYTVYGNEPAEKRARITR